GSFPPKDLLPAAALAEQRFALGQSGDAPPDGTTPAERVITLLRAPTDALTNAPRLAAAMLQAMASGEPDVAPLLGSLTEPLVAETAHAIRPENPTPRTPPPRRPRTRPNHPTRRVRRRRRLGQRRRNRGLDQPRRRNRCTPTPRPRLNRPGIVTAPVTGFAGPISETMRQMCRYGGLTARAR